jgi:protein-tyrosine-phosphatase
MTAEYCLKDYLAKNSIENFEVSSAGTDADSDLTGYSMAHFDELKKFGIDASRHQRTQITKEIADEADLIISMDDHHKQYVLEKFGVRSPLYNEISKNESTSILCSAMGGANKDENMQILVHYFHDSMPTLAQNLGKMI